MKTEARLTTSPPLHPCYPKIEAPKPIGPLVESRAGFGAPFAASIARATSRSHVLLDTSTVAFVGCASSPSRVLGAEKAALEHRFSRCVLDCACPDDAGPTRLGTVAAAPWAEWSLGHAHTRGSLAQSRPGLYSRRRAPLQSFVRAFSLSNSHHWPADDVPNHSRSALSEARNHP
jgi:hypothetical protein